MIIEKNVENVAEDMAYDIFEINDELMEIEITQAEAEFDAGEIKVYLTGHYYIDFKTAFYKDGVFKEIRERLDKFKDKELSEEKIYEIAMKEFVAIDSDYDYYVYEVDSTFDIDMRHLIDWFDSDLGYRSITLEDDETGEVIVGRVKESLEEEYGHYGTKVNVENIINSFSNYDENVLIDYINQ